MSNSLEQKKNQFIPKKLQYLQEKILNLRNDSKIELQNGDEGYANAPSNIALLKYWGKELNQNQIPSNSSISLTLNGFRSFTKVTCLGRFLPENECNQIQKFLHKFTLKNEENNIISNTLPSKMELFLNSILHPFANDIGLHVESLNNFPTACGIASSASGYAALVGAIADLFQLSKHFTQGDLQYWLCEWSRLGSGSATRSAILEENSLNTSSFVCWHLENKNNFFETKTVKAKSDIIWNKVQHCVLVLDSHEKSITSSDGHKSAKTSPFYEIRKSGINVKLNKILDAIEHFNFETVKQLTEEDAFFMHAVMQTQRPPACYLTHNVADIISKFILYRDANNLQAFWTLDAGPNIHFIFMGEHKKIMEEFFYQIQKNSTSKIIKYYNKSENFGLVLGKLK